MKKIIFQILDVNNNIIFENESMELRDKRYDELTQSNSAMKLKKSQVNFYTE
jgi:hypothetical protein